MMRFHDSRRIAFNREYARAPGGRPILRLMANMVFDSETGTGRRLYRNWFGPMMPAGWAIEFGMTHSRTISRVCFRGLTAFPPTKTNFAAHAQRLFGSRLATPNDDEGRQVQVFHEYVPVAQIRASMIHFNKMLGVFRSSQLRAWREAKFLSGRKVNSPSRRILFSISTMRRPADTSTSLPPASRIKMRAATRAPTPALSA